MKTLPNVRAVAADNEFGHFRRANVAPVGSADPVDHIDGARWVMDRLECMVSIMRRLRDEKESGADLACALRALRAGTQAEVLARMSGMCAGSGRAVTDAELDLLDALVAWLDKAIPDKAEQYILLAWAGGEGQAALGLTVGCSQQTMSRRICGLRARLEKTFGVVEKKVE